MTVGFADRAGRHPDSSTFWTDSNFVVSLDLARLYFVFMYPSLLERLRDRGYRLTSQRRVVAEVLDGDHVHMTADEVLEAAVGRLPEISRATVYNTLRELTELGEVLELNLDGRSKRYDPNVTRAHHHLVCDGCGMVFDVQFEVEAPALAATETHGMKLGRAEIVHHGTCPTCTN